MVDEIGLATFGGILLKFVAGVEVALRFGRLFLLGRLVPASPRRGTWTAAVAGSVLGVVLWLRSWGQTCCPEKNFTAQCATA